MLPFDSSDHVEAQRVGDNFRNSYHKSIDEDVELELVKHECRCVELEDDCAL
jgi:hypothetical protein